MKQIATTLILMLICINVFSQKDSVAINSNLLIHSKDVPYYRLGDKITISGKSYIFTT